MFTGISPVRLLTRPWTQLYKHDLSASLGQVESGKRTVKDGKIMQIIIRFHMQMMLKDIRRFSARTKISPKLIDVQQIPEMCCGFSSAMYRRHRSAPCNRTQTPSYIVILVQHTPTDRMATPPDSYSIESLNRANVVAAPC